MSAVVLKDWVARRAGGHITVKHSSGRVTKVERIYPDGSQLIAVAADGKRYALQVAPSQ